MFCDVFNKKQALKLLKGKHIWFIGSSNMRAIYKDLLWLITHGNIAPVQSFQVRKINFPCQMFKKYVLNMQDIFTTCKCTDFNIFHKLFVFQNFDGVVSS